MEISNEGIKLIRRFENRRLKAYKCPAGVWTIGDGNTFYEDGKPVREGDIITAERADALFASILSGFADQLRSKLGIIVLNKNQFNALLSFLQNIGPGSSTKSGLFRLKNGQPSTLWKLVLQNPNNPLIAKEFVKWVSPGTNYENGLKNRREAEVELYFS